MTATKRVCYTLLLTSGFGLVVASGYAAFYIAPTFQELSHRALAGLLAVLAGVAGIAVITKSFSKVEAASSPTSQPHLPGLDVEVEETKKLLK